MAPRRRTAGFTLIELMIVSAIISIIVLAFQPSFAKNIADKRTVAAVSEFVRVGRRARADAIGLQRAHLMFIQPSSGAQQTGVVELLRGNSSHCDIENWLALQRDCTAAAPPFQRVAAMGSACPEILDLNETSWYRAPYAIHLREVAPGDEANVRAALIGTAATQVSLCYEPQGIVRWATGVLTATMTFSSLSSGAATGGGFQWAMGLMQSGTPVGVAMFIATPLAGPPRRLR